MSYLGVNTEETLKQDDIAKDKGIDRITLLQSYINDALSYISIYNVLSYLGVNAEETLKQDDIAKDKGIAESPYCKAISMVLYLFCLT